MDFDSTLPWNLIYQYQAGYDDSPILIPNILTTNSLVVWVFINTNARGYNGGWIERIAPSPNLGILVAEKQKLLNSWNYPYRSFNNLINWQYSILPSYQVQYVPPSYCYNWQICIYSQ